MTTTDERRFPRIAPRHVERLCGRTHAERGRGVFERGQVLGAVVAEELGELIGLVLGTAPEPYAQNIDLSPDGHFDNDCTCPVGESCKHVAAVLYHYIAHRDEIVRGGRGFADGEAGPGDGLGDGSGDGADGGAALERWLAGVARAGEMRLALPDAPSPGSHVLLYQLDSAPLDAPLGTLRAGGDGGGRNGWWGSAGDGAGTAAPEPIALRLSLRRSRLLKAGGFGKEGAANLSGYALPDWLTALDRDIVAQVEGMARRIHRYGYADRLRGVPIEGPSGARLLRLLVESGRCFVGAGRERPLRPGGERALALDWEPAAGERVRLGAALEGIGRWAFVGTAPPWYLGVAGDDGGAGGVPLGGPAGGPVSGSVGSPAGGPVAGPIGAAPSAPLLQALLAGPALDAAGAWRASALLEEPSLQAPLSGVRLPAPDAGDAAIVEATPVPVLRLHARDASADPLDYRATFALRYGEDLLPFDDVVREPRTVLDDERGRRVVRRRVEEEIERAYELIGLCPALEPVEEEPNVLAPPGEAVPARVLAWREVLESLPELEALGWEIETRPPFALDFERLGGEGVDARVGEGEHGWFTLSLAMVHEGQRFALLPLIVAWLEAGEPERPILVESESGRWLEVAPEVFMPVAETLIELFDHFPEGEALRLPRQRVPLLDALDAAWGGSAVWRGGEALFALAERLRGFDGIARPALPAALEATLRPYQHDGVAWLGFLAEFGFGGILADDMGLGKTLQTLAHLLIEREAGRLPGATLVVAPTSLLGNWQREAERFVPGLRCVVWHGAERHARGLDASATDLVVTSYALALRDRDLLAEQPFDALVLDEAQLIKNPASKTARAVKSLPVERRLCLSGTPLENHLGELWSQFDFLMPGYLGDRDRFTRRFRTPIEKHGDADRQARLNALVRPFMLRRRKEEVATELPPKTDIVQSVTLGAAQARLYESIRLSMEAKVKKLLAGKGLARSRIELLDALLKLRQTCCHPALVKLPSAKKVQESAKTEQLMAMLEELVAEGRRILVFSQFTAMLALIEGELAGRGIGHVKLTGRTRRRDAVVDAFQSGEVPLFLISLKAGGTGLNLTAADTVIHYDPWWNPAVEAQASARAHRIGQDKPVFVYRLVAADTVEERILEMQRTKQALADATVDGGRRGRGGAGGGDGGGGGAGDGAGDGGGALAGLTSDELLGLFAARD